MVLKGPVIMDDYKKLLKELAHMIVDSQSPKLPLPKLDEPVIRRFPDGGSEIVYCDGTVIRSDEVGRLHSRGGEPSVVRSNGAREWHEHGRKHRVGGPAVINADGSQLFYLHGRELSKDEALGGALFTAKDLARAWNEGAAWALGNPYAPRDAG